MQLLPPIRYCNALVRFKRCTGPLETKTWKKGEKSLIYNFFRQFSEQDMATRIGGCYEFFMVAAKIFVYALVKPKSAEKAFKVPATSLA